MPLVEYLAEERAKDRKAGIAVLEGCQWAITEMWELEGGPVYKIIGRDPAGMPVSGTVDYFKSRSFCGICYWGSYEKAKNEANRLQEAYREKNLSSGVFEVFNPYRNLFEK